MSSHIYFGKLIFHGTLEIDNYYYKNKQAKEPNHRFRRDIYMVISIIYIYVFVVQYMTIFFFTLTTYVAHGDVNINVMYMSMLYKIM